MQNKKLFLLIAALVVLLAGFVVWQFTRDNGEAPGTDTATNDQTGNALDRLRIIATGDMIAHDSVIANAQDNGSYDFYSLMQNMQPYFDAADVRFCNEATPAGGEEFGISGFPIFNAPLEWHDGMEQLGCNVINLGTNHTYDKGEGLVDAMVADWQDRDVLATAGAHRNQPEREQISYFEVGDTTFAFLSYSTYSNEPVPNDYSLVMYDEATATSEIMEARENADIVLVSMRWGIEYDTSESAEQREIATTIAEAGADFVFGHGPHTLQPVDRIDRGDGSEAIVWYSLGNFLNTQIPADTLVSVIAVIDLDPDDFSVQSIGALPVYSHYEWSAEEADAQNLLARRNLQMYALDGVDDSYFERNQLDTTVQAERQHLTNVLNQLTDIKILNTENYLE
jgi:hypothetical protein